MSKRYLCSDKTKRKNYFAFDNSDMKETNKNIPTLCTSL